MSGTRLSYRVALGALFLLIALLCIRQVGSHDLGFHLNAGEQILGGGGFPVHDTFTYTINDHPYVDTTWGYQVAITLIQRVAGPAGQVLAHGLAILAVFGMVFAAGRRIGADPLSLLLLLFAATLMSEIRFEVRPEVASWLFLAAVLLVCHHHAEGGRGKLWLLPVLQGLWVNVHGLFILGWGVIGAFVVGTWLRDRKLDRRLLAFGAGAMAVSILNPYGLRGVLFPLTLATRLDSGNVFAQEIGELLSLWRAMALPGHNDLAYWLYWWFAAAALLSLPGWIRDRRYPDLLLALMFFPLAFQTVRNLPLAAIVCAPGIACALRLDERLAGVAGESTLPLRSWGLALFTTLTLVVGLRVYQDAWYVDDRRGIRFGVGWNADRLPVEAVAYLRVNPPRGRVLNQLGFGGQLMWGVPTKVFVDTRLEVLGEEFYEIYKQVLSSEQALAAAVDRWGIGWIVLSHRQNPVLTRQLSRDARWRLVHADPLAAVWVDQRENLGFPASASLQRLSTEFSFPDLQTLPGLGGPPRRGSLTRWAAGLVTRQRFPTRDFRLGLFHYFRGEAEYAAARFANAIAGSRGDYPEIYNNLGTVLLYLDRFDEAADCFRVVLDADPDDAHAREHLELARRKRRPTASGEALLPG